MFGEAFTAEQTQDTLTIAIANQKGFEWVYRLDRQVAHNVFPGPAPSRPAYGHDLRSWLRAKCSAGISAERAMTRRFTRNEGPGPRPDVPDTS